MVAGPRIRAKSLRLLALACPSAPRAPRLPFEARAAHCALPHRAISLNKELRETLRGALHTPALPPTDWK